MGVIKSCVEVEPHIEKAVKEAISTSQKSLKFHHGIPGYNVKLEPLQ